MKHGLGSGATDRPARGEAIDADTFCDAFARTVANQPSDIALRTTVSDQSLTWKQFDDAARQIAGGLRQGGVRAGDRVVMLLTNRMEAAITDMATLLLGAIPISLYNSSSIEQLAFMLEDSGASAVVTERQLAAKMVEATGRINHHPFFVVVDGNDADVTFDRLSHLGTPLVADEQPALDGDDVVSIVYTSGTTGRPKGVQIRHGSVLSQLRALRRIGQLPSRGNVLSYLPFAHLGDRLCSYYMPLVMGATIVYHPDPRTAIDVLPQVHSTMFMTVPRIWQKIQSSIEVFVDRLDDVERRHRIRTAIEVGRQVQRETKAGRVPSADLLEGWRRGDGEFAWLREEFGFAEAEVLYTGAAPLPMETLEFFTSLGIDVVESYGLTESSGLILCNPRGNSRPNRVGVPLDGVELRLAADGELFVRGRQVMKGYWGRPDLTAEVIDAEGWMATGDIAAVDDEGYWRIVDRKKELIVSSSGKNMAPSHIENVVMTTSPLFGNVVCVGDAKPYNCALVTVDPENVAAIANTEDLIQNIAHPRVIDAIRRAITDANTRLNGSERIRRFLVLSDVWLPGGDELTPTSKLRRRAVSEKYADHIAALYEDDPDRSVVHDVVQRHDPKPLAQR